jgi:hypothetical protein
METLDLPRIGNRDDALELLDELIEIAKASAEENKALTLGLLALRDVIDRYAI